MQCSREKENEEAAIQVLVLPIYLYDVLAHESQARSLFRTLPSLLIFTARNEEARLTAHLFGERP